MRIAKPCLATVALVSTLMGTSSFLGAAEPNKAVPEGQAVTTELGTDSLAISYWTSTPQGWVVVTTIDTVSGRDTDAERHAIARFSATLSPGETQLISVPVTIGQDQPTLRIRRVGDQIEVARADGSSI